MAENIVRSNLSLFIPALLEFVNLLDFHVNSIKLHGKGTKEAVPAPASVTEPADDLPF